MRGHSTRPPFTPHLGTHSQPAPADTTGTRDHTTATAMEGVVTTPAMPPQDPTGTQMVPNMPNAPVRASIATHFQILHSSSLILSTPHYPHHNLSILGFALFGAIGTGGGGVMVSAFRFIPCTYHPVPKIGWFWKIVPLWG